LKDTLLIAHIFGRFGFYFALSTFSSSGWGLDGSAVFFLGVRRSKQASDLMDVNID
jgi:hypothetical protein